MKLKNESIAFATLTAQSSQFTYYHGRDENPIPFCDGIRKKELKQIIQYKHQCSQTYFTGKNASQRNGWSVEGRRLLKINQRKTRKKNRIVCWNINDKWNQRRFWKSQSIEIQGGNCQPLKWCSVPFNKSSIKCNVIFASVATTQNNLW